MLLRRSILALGRRTAVKPIVPVAPRVFTTSAARRAGEQGDPKPGEPDKKMMAFEDIRTEEDLLPPGAEPGTVPTDLDQSTGLERFEILGKMQGIDVFDMKPLDASRKGTLEDPIIVNSAGDEQFAGCTGYPVDSHVVLWLNMRRDRPVERCAECGSVYRMEYIGPPDDPHAHHGHGEEHGEEHGDGAHSYEEPKTFADFVRPEYRGTPQPHYRQS
ncbi:MAG: Cytochrome c oxidase subunit 4 [Alectoria fallacina]|uniref:Cytochrome c oxidase subunit 4, mitochondrial n=1 Tax=Alectoria fallacina TaxID=1903189 RepID=A0A8H3G9L6_9LECA|nr:MAG: Cytochrome c oxidase subunit 4 [Alectoria fallacina]